MKIERHDKKQGMQKVTLLSDGSADISKEQAIESLGQKAAKYVVVNWSTSVGGDAASKPEMKSNLLAESQEWTNKAGTTITAAVLKVESGKVYFLMDGKTIPYEVDNLSGETIERLKGIMAQNAQ